MNILKFKHDDIKIKIKISQENFVLDSLLDFYEYLNVFILTYSFGDFSFDDISLNIVKRVSDRYNNFDAIEIEIVKNNIGFVQKYKIINGLVCYEFE